MTPALINAGDLLSRPSSARGQYENLNNWIISAAKRPDGQYVVVSRYGDDKWQFLGGATNALVKAINFTTIPECFRADTKAMFYRYCVKGREGVVKPAISTIISSFVSIRAFLKWLYSKNVSTITQITPLHCLNYVKYCKEYKKNNGQSLSFVRLKIRFIAFEAIFELSQHSNNPMPEHPWPESSAWLLAGGNKEVREGRTLCIPDNILIPLFQKASELVESGNYLLDLRDNKTHIAELGRAKDLAKLNEQLLELCTACYIILVITSGCRNHELAYLKNDPGHPDRAKRHPWYSTEDEDGIRYWWMRSRSDKTHTGETEWMIPEKAVEALKIMERWALPYQEEIKNEISMLTTKNPHDPQIIEANRHRHALFLGKNKRSGLVRTLSNGWWNSALRNFARCCGLDFKVSNHMFRKTFAVYAAKSPYGDLVYMRDHFKHWSLDMHALYALNEHQDLDLYGEVLAAKEDIKIGIVEHWLNQDTLLTGGATKKIKHYRESIPELKVFKTRKAMAEAISDQVHIRAAGHVWCINDTAGCKSQGLLDRTNCVECENSVIDDTKKTVWQGIYQQQLELLEIDDIGQAAKDRVRRDVNKVAQVLTELGIETLTMSRS